MDSGVTACSQGLVVNAPNTTLHRTSSIAEGLEVHPFWSSAKAEGSENPPPYTDGPSRVILANDGTKDCLALLFTPILVAALNQIPHYIRALETRDGALENIESTIIDLSCKADHVEETMRNPRYQDRAEEMQLAWEILRLKQQEAEERKSQLNVELLSFESSLKLSRHQSQGILEQALLEACLLDPPEPWSPPVYEEVDDASTGDYSDAPSMYQGTEPTPEQQLFREARMDVVESHDTLRTYQARFDDRHADYEEKLAEFQRSEAKFDGTRTHFDHQHIQHVQKLTRDLISAEEGYRTARAKARALESPAHPNGHDGHRTSDDVSTKPSIDRKCIEAWARDVVPDHDVKILENKEPLDLDGWNARPVEIMDSISVIDREEYVDEINDWKKHCRVLREEVPVGLWRKTDIDQE